MAKIELELCSGSSDNNETKDKNFFVVNDWVL